MEMRRNSWILIENRGEMTTHILVTIFDFLDTLH